MWSNFFFSTWHPQLNHLLSIWHLCVVVWQEASLGNPVWPELSVCLFGFCGCFIWHMVSSSTGWFQDHYAVKDSHDSWCLPPIKYLFSVLWGIHPRVSSMLRQNCTNWAVSPARPVRCFNGDASLLYPHVSNHICIFLSNPSGKDQLED